MQVKIRRDISFLSGNIVLVSRDVHCASFNGQSLRMDIPDVGRVPVSLIEGVLQVGPHLRVISLEVGLSCIEKSAIVIFDSSNIALESLGWVVFKDGPSIARSQRIESAESIALWAEAKFELKASALRSRVVKIGH